MSKKFLFFSTFILISILLIAKAEEEIEENSDYDDGYGIDYFKESVKQYLIDRNLFDSEELVKPEEMKKIFLEIITEGDYESSTEYFGGIFNELADFFVNSYYINKKEIKGKDIYDLIDINQISQKFEEMLGDNPNLNGMYGSNYYGDDNENDDYDTRDDVGESTSDV